MRNCDSVLSFGSTMLPFLCVLGGNVVFISGVVNWTSTFEVLNVVLCCSDAVDVTSLFLKLFSDAPFSVYKNTDPSLACLFLFLISLPVPICAFCNLY